MSSKVAGTWKVRPMPAQACASGDARVMSRPAKRILPSVGTVSPARQLKKVDLPAPFGPISPTISPSSTDKSAWRTAKKLPNALETLCASRSIFAPPPSWRDAFPHLEQSSRFVSRYEHDDPPVENECETCAAAAEPGIGGRLQRNQN